MFGLNKRYLIVSINDGVIKLVQASSAGYVEKVARASFTVSANLEEATKALKTLLVAFDRKLPVVCVIPAHAATVKNIEVPSVDPQEIRSIIHLQASRHTPYSKEEVLISYVHLGMNAANNTRLLLVIAHRDVVKERVTILEKSGLSVDRILFAPEAQARFYAKPLVSKKETGPLGIIDFGTSTTNYIIIFKGSLLFERSIPIGIKALAESPDVALKFQDELIKSMDAFTQEDGSQPPETYAVTGSCPAVEALLPILKENLGMEFKVNAFLNHLKTSVILKKRLQNDWNDDSFLDVIAPATTLFKCEVNVMPEEMILKKTVERQSKEAIKTGVCAVIIMVLIIVMAMSKIYFKDTFLNKNLREQFAAQKKEVLALQERMNKAKLVRGYIKNRMAALDLIHELYAITPHSVYLNAVTVDAQGLVTIDGIADSMSQVFSYVKSLDDSSLFKEAKTKSTSTKKDNGKDVAAFEIEFKIDNFKEPS